jgi:asparaginyl-tRNA synthetase
MGRDVTGPRNRNSLDADRFLQVLADPWYRTLVALQDGLSFATATFWRGRGLRTLHLPVTTSAVSSPMGLGSDSSPVAVDLFGVRTYLADSMQFMLEYGCRLSAEGAYYVMPSFRGEDADATHLCQFFHSEAEIPGTLDDVIATVEAYLTHLCRWLLDNLHQEILAVVDDVAHLEELASGEPLPRLTFDEAATLLGGAEPYVRPVADGARTLTRTGEAALIAKFGGYAWVTHWDHLAVPFYQAFGDSDRRTACNADLLFGLGEVIGAGERHRTGEEVLVALDQHHVPADPYDWYVRMKAEYPMKTSGFGLGIERFLAWVLKHDDVRDLQLLPRHNGIATAP